MLLEIMAELGPSPERTLMIGDTTHDLQMARNAGVACAGGRLWRAPALRSWRPSGRLACSMSFAN
jgi:phosphoglycolate phosphatase-like HAD superfamily hydrolase